MMVDNSHSCNRLFSHYQSEKLTDLFVLHGNMSANGFLSNIGCIENNNKVVQTSLTHSRVAPCDILLGIGEGYQGLCISNKMSGKTLYFITWVLPQL